MTNLTQPAEKVQNYSDAQVAELVAFVTGIEAVEASEDVEAVEAVAGQNHNLASAKFFADKFGKSYQSVIAKIKNLDLGYDRKPAPRKKAVQTTKAELVEVIAKRLDRDMTGLEKSTRGALLLLINGLDHAIPEKELSDELPELGDSAVST